eukprot:gene5340-512_t
MQLLLFKRYSCKGMKEWCIDAEVIAPGSADSALEGRHYFRSMRLHKECFDALVQFRIEHITDGHSKTDPHLMATIEKLRKEPSPSTMNDLIYHPSFAVLCQNVLCYEEESEGHLTVQYLKDVSSTLRGYSADPFSNETPRCFHSGALITPSICKDMLKAHDVGNSVDVVYNGSGEDCDKSEKPEDYEDEESIWEILVPFDLILTLSVSAQNTTFSSLARSIF